MSKQILKLQKHLNKLTETNSFRTLEDSTSFEEFILANSKRDYFLESNFKNKEGKGSETGVGMFLVKSLINPATESVAENMSLYLEKKKRSTNISRFFMMNTTYMNIDEDGLCKDSIKSSVAIAAKEIINYMFKDVNYQVKDLDNVERFSKYTKLHALYKIVGNAIIEEQIMNSVMIQQPELFKSTMRRNVNSTFEKLNKLSRANSNIQCINKNGKDKNGNQMLNVDKKDKNNDVAKIGAFFVENIIASTNLFEVKTVQDGNKKVKLICLSEELEQKICDVDNFNSILNPKHLPRPEKFGLCHQWTNFNDGAYQHIDVNFIKGVTKANLKKLRVQTYEEAFEAANNLQNTKFKVNQTVFSVIKHLIDNDVRWTNKDNALILPFKSGHMTEELSKLPSHLEEFKSEIKSFNKERNEFKNKKGSKKVKFPKRLTIESKSKKFQKAYEEYKQHQIKIRYEQEFLIANKSKLLSLIEAMRIADMMGNEGFYLPVNIDWRSRFYYLPMLNPQTSDNIKAMLSLGDSKRIEKDDKEAFYFMNNCGANDYGLDKEHPDFKNAWVMENIDKIIASGYNPLDNIDFWGNADKPFMFLNFCSEMAEFAKNDFEFLDSTYICYFDGSCNGTQHFAAMTGDRNAARLTNLTDSDKREDLYTEVAEQTEEYITELSKGKLIISIETAFGKNVIDYTDAKQDPIQTAKEALEFGIKRKLVKQNVMTMTYGATDYGRLEQVSSVYKEVIQNKGTLPFDQQTIGYKASLVSKIAYGAIQKTNPGVVACMNWLEQCMEIFYRVRVLNSEGRMISSGLNPRWTNSCGVEVMQFYKKQKIEKVAFNARTKEVKLYTHTDTNEMHKSKNTQGIIPNFVHSQDAAHMAKTINECAKHFSDFSCVHDSFGCNAKDAAKLFQIVRKTFIDMYQENVLVKLYNEWFGQISKHDLELAKELPKPPAKGDYEVAESLGSLYSFI